MFSEINFDAKINFIKKSNDESNNVIILCRVGEDSFGYRYVKICTFLNCKIVLTDVSAIKGCVFFEKGDLVNVVGKIYFTVNPKTNEIEGLIYNPVIRKLYKHSDDEWAEVSRRRMRAGYNLPKRDANMIDFRNDGEIDEADVELIGDSDVPF